MIYQFLALIYLSLFFIYAYNPIVLIQKKSKEKNKDQEKNNYSVVPILYVKKTNLISSSMPFSVSH